MTQATIKAGDFTQLATSYAHYRPSYSETVLCGLLGITRKPIDTLAFVDVGAGTGIWTRQVAAQGCQSVIAVEPNRAMREAGQTITTSSPIQWIPGSAEHTELLSESVDLLTMASSFHWADFELATQEFYRVLKPHGHFAALWNPRFLDEDPLLLEIEDYIVKLEPSLQRVSSGKSDHVNQLMARLKATPLFKDMIYLEGLHTARLNREQYIGVWQSVNDIRAQLGEEKFSRFMTFVSDKTQNHTYIDCRYKTRAWIVQKNSTLV